MSTSRLRILIAPLDWGLGHASRCIPLIRRFQQEGAEVILAGNGCSSAWLCKRFPELEFHPLPDHGIRFPRHRHMVWSIMLRWPLLLTRVRKEKRILDGLIRKRDIRVVISDNRYGLWSDQITSILITHQLFLKLPAGLRWAEGIVRAMLRKHFRHFTQVWIPDLPGEQNLSGALSHGFALPGNARFVGFLSRFSEHIRNPEDQPPTDQAWDVLAILSGPEPQRSIFEDRLKSQMIASGLRCCLLRGKPDLGAEKTVEGNVHTLNHADDDVMAAMILNAQIVVCRPGYSTLMDLLCFGSRAVLVPTPGQTEQEYLAGMLKSKGRVYSCRQEDFNLQEAITQGRQHNGFRGIIPQASFFTPVLADLRGQTEIG